MHFYTSFMLVLSVLFYPAGELCNNKSPSEDPPEADAYLISGAREPRRREAGLGERGAGQSGQAASEIKEAVANKIPWQLFQPTLQRTNGGFENKEQRQCLRWGLSPEKRAGRTQARTIHRKKNHHTMTSMGSI